MRAMSALAPAMRAALIALNRAAVGWPVQNGAFGSAARAAPVRAPDAGFRAGALRTEVGALLAVLVVAAGAPCEGVTSPSASVQPRARRTSVRGVVTGPPKEVRNRSNDSGGRRLP